MLKVALLLPSLDSTGPIFVAHKIVEQLKNEVDFTVFYFNPIESLIFDCKTIRIGFFEKYDFSGFDLIHSHMWQPDLYLVYHSKNIKVKKITTFHQYIFENYKYSHNAFFSFILTNVWLFKINLFDQVVCINKHMASFYKQKKINTNISSIYNGVTIQTNISAIDIEDLKTIQLFKNQYTILGSMAKFDARKGIDQIVKLLALNPKLAFVLVGDGSEKKKLIQLAIQLNVRDRILFTGFRKNAIDYLVHFDLYVMPSRSEGFGLALMEAVASKIPVVCSNIISFKELFNPLEVSFFELDNISSLNDAITNSMLNREILIANSYTRYENNYTEKIMAHQYMKLYQNI